MVSRGVFPVEDLAMNTAAVPGGGLVMVGGFARIFSVLCRALPENKSIRVGYRRYLDKIGRMIRNLLRLL